MLMAGTARTIRWGEYPADAGGRFGEARRRPSWWAPEAVSRSQVVVHEVGDRLHPPMPGGVRPEQGFHASSGSRRFRK